MKAWICREESEGNGTIIFAETAGKARYIAMCSDSLGDDLTFKDIHVKRVPQMDKYYRGAREMDWYEEADRIAMVKEAGFACHEDYLWAEECKECPAKEWCSTYGRMNNESHQNHLSNL